VHQDGAVPGGIIKSSSNLHGAWLDVVFAFVSGFGCSLVVVVMAKMMARRAALHVETAYWSTNGDHAWHVSSTY